MQYEEFLILEHLSHKDVDHDIKLISDAIKISLNKISEISKNLLNNNYIQVNNNELFITKTGIQAIEIYKVDKAIILAAGLGSRMMPATQNYPKPMIKVNGKRIIETLIEALHKADIQDITIVTGYKGEKFQELNNKFEGLKFVENKLYETHNNISSIAAVLDEFDSCYLCEADLLISNSNIITKYQYDSNILGSFAVETDDWCFHMNENGFARNYNKGGKFCYNYHGISFWTKNDAKKLKQHFSETYYSNKEHDLFWEFIPLVKFKDDYNVRIRICDKTDIVEIDSYEELKNIDESYT